MGSQAQFAIFQHSVLCVTGPNRDKERMLQHGGSLRRQSSEFVATYPSAGGRRETRGMRVPRKEYARSRHQRLFEENVGKNRKRRDLRTFK